MSYYCFLCRSFALKVGLQITLREYDFDNKNKATFSGSDIMNIFPVVKHINPRVSSFILHIKVLLLELFSS